MFHAPLVPGIPLRKVIAAEDLLPGSGRGGWEGAAFEGGRAHNGC